MKRKILNGFLLMALSVSSVNTFVACKDYDEDMWVDVKSQIIGESTSLRDALAKQKSELEALVAACKQACAADQAQNAVEHETLKRMIEAAEGEIAQLNAKLAEMEGNYAQQFNETNTRISTVEALLKAAMEEAGAQYLGLAQKIDSLSALTVGWNEDIKNAADNANEALALAIRDSIRLDAIESLIANGTISEEYLKENYYSKEEIDALVSKLREESSEIKGIADEALQKALENAASIDTLEMTVGELNKSVDAVWKELDELKDALDTITERVNKLVADLKAMITGIIVQASDNTVVGYLNTPLGVTSNILAVYYGTPDADWTFPSTNPSDYVNAEEYNLWNKRNLQVVDMDQLKGEAGQMLVTADGEAGNAGKLYVTVNPSTVEFENKSLYLKDSQDEDAPAKLEALKKSDKLLNFGYTRGENGFYEAAATITAENVENATVNFDIANIKDEAIAMLKERSKGSVLSMGYTIAQNIDNVATAYAVMGKWEDSEGVEHKTYSNYGVAAVAVKPLSFSFAQDFSVKGQLPGIGRLQNVVGRIINKIKVDLDLPSGDDLDINFEGVDIDGIDFSTLKVKLTLRLDGDDEIKIIGENNTIYTVTVEAGQVTKIVDEKGISLELEKDKDGNLYVEKAKLKNEKLDDKWFLTCNYYFGDEMKEIIADLAADFNEIPGDLADLLNEVKDLSKIQASIDTAKENVKDQINGYITRINNKLSQWINRTPAMLHLAVIATEGDKAGLLSQSKLMPTKASGELTLVPTTYSLELLAPAYKKFVAVTDVFNANGTEADIQKAKDANANGENLNTVVNSDVTCTLNGEKGYIYEVTYTAVDYAGKVSLRKYYVQF